MDNLDFADMDWQRLVTNDETEHADPPATGTWVPNKPVLHSDGGQTRVLVQTRQHASDGLHVRARNHTADDIEDADRIRTLFEVRVSP